MSLSRRNTLILIILAVAVITTYWWTRNSQPKDDTSLEYTIIAENLEIPWSIAITQSGEIFLTERKGNINLVKNGTLTTIHTIGVYHQNTEGGLLGITMHPDYEQNYLLYTYHTYKDQESLWNKVTQYSYNNQTLTNETTIIDKIPGGQIHDGGRIKFGPDKKLYITTGETGVGELAQDPESLAGKILRLNPDGSLPDDNPIYGSPIYSLGHRNPQGLTWHPKTGELYSTEHGPSGEKLTFAHDEINVIQPKSNYGWPYIVGMEENSDYTNPIYHTGSVTWAPSGATFLDDPSSPWQNRLFVACLRGNGIRMINFSDPQYKEVDNVTHLFEELGRVRTVVQGPNGYLYFCTSNRDGRGIPKENDDILARFKPSE
jgi:glucose/arabinose dehydrogenase